MISTKALVRSDLPISLELTPAKKAQMGGCSTRGGPDCRNLVWHQMREIIIELVRTIPALLPAFAAIVRFGDDDDERLSKLESVVNDMQSRLGELQLLIDQKKHEKA